MSEKKTNPETRPQGNLHNTFHLPEPFSFGKSPMRWHPKVTTYRLLVLLTIICLGAGKAVTSAQGAVVVSVTAEWVSGVAVFVLLYGVGLYDEDSLRQRMRWLFNKDLAGYLWSISYRTDEEKPALWPHLPRYPPITGYRVAVSASVLLFGVAKAALGYLGHSLAANTADWVFGVVMASALYCIGLYENNPVDLFPTFFSTDYRPYLRREFFREHILEVPKYSLGLILSIGLIYPSVLALSYRWTHLDEFKYLVVDSYADAPFFDSAHDVSLNLMIAELLLLAVAVDLDCLTRFR